jgi:hypothetical protein
MRDEETRMWHAQHTLETTTTPESIWRCWTNVPGWPDWDEGLEWATLQGPMAVGTAGVIKCRSGERLAFRVIEFIEGRSFTCLGRKLGTDLRFVHRLEPSSLGTKLTHRVEAQGPLAWLLGLTLGRRIQKSLPIAARKLAHLAEKS